MNRPSANEQELLERALRHDEQAFAAIVDLYTPAIFRIARRMVFDTMEAASIVQEAFWRLWKALPRYDTDRPLLPYLAAIASNLARDRFRRDRLLEDVDIADIPDPEAREEDADIEQAAEDDTGLGRLAALVDELPFAYRSVIALRYEAEMSYEEIAAALSLPVNTVRTHLRRAKELLRRGLEDTDNG